MTGTPPAYLDYAATTPVDPRVAARMAGCLTREGVFGNPGSASHAYGDAAGALVETARGQVARAVGADAADIIWTSGATEANNLALFGVANHHRGPGHVITVRTEHKAVLDPCRELQRRGWRVTYLVPGPTGLLDPAQVGAALALDTVLVSVMHVNNEIGVIQPLAAIAALCRGHGSVVLHVDAAQSVGKCAVDFASLGADLMSLSAHKAYGPKGAGALVVSRGRRVQLQPLMFGGGQERQLRPGTLPTHQLVGMGAAFELAAASLAEETARVTALRDRLWHGLNRLGGVLRNGNAGETVAQLLNVSFDDVDGESLLADVRPFIAVSTGSACTSAAREPSYVLRALGRDARLAESSLRFSLGRFSAEADIDAALTAVSRAIRRLRRVAGRGGAGVASALPDLEPPAVAEGYSNLTWQRFRVAARAGALEGPGVGRGEAGGPRHGAWVRFDVRRDRGAGLPGADGLPAATVAEVRFSAYGCPHVIAAADWVAEMAMGREAVATLPETVAALQARFAVPTEKLGRLLILEDAWKAAISSPC